MLTRRLARMANRWTAFARNGSGVAAIEFAVAAPFLLLLYLGGTELAMALAVNRKVHHTASMVNDLVTQATQLTAAELAGIFNISRSVLAPYDDAPMRIKVTAVAIDGTGRQTVDWSCVSGDMPRSAEGSPFPLPAEFATLRSRTVLVAETRYDFAPVVGRGFTNGMIEMGGISFLNPRSSDTIVSDGC